MVVCVLLYVYQRFAHESLKLNARRVSNRFCKYPSILPCSSIVGDIGLMGNCLVAVKRGDSQRSVKSTTTTEKSATEDEASGSSPKKVEKRVEKRVVTRVEKLPLLVAGVLASRKRSLPRQQVILVMRTELGVVAMARCTSASCKIRGSWLSKLPTLGRYKERVSFTRRLRSCRECITGIL